MEIVSTEEYWQLILNDLSKVGQITTEDEEFNKIATYTWSVLQNTLVPSEDENYIKSFEEMVEIDGEGLDVLQRKVNILTTLSTKKYVPKNLIKLALERMDVGRFEIDYDRDSNKLTVVTDNLNEELLTNVTNLVNNVVSDKIEKEMDNLGFIPDGWTRVDYLESMGSKHIVTNFILDSECSVLCDLQAIGTDAGEDIYGNSPNSSSRFNLTRNWGKFRVDFANIQQVTSFAHNSERCVTELNSSGFTINGNTELSFANVTPFTTSSPFHIFKNTVSNTYHFKGRIFDLRVKKENKLVFEATPCLDDTGAPCMYDRVSKTAFYNSGSGDFTYPTQSTTYSLRRRVLPDWGKFTEHGLRRLYHAPADYEGELIEYALEHDYKQIIETEMPEEGHWIPQWRETEEEIVLEWIETEEPILEQPITE